MSEDEDKADVLVGKIQRKLQSDHEDLSKEPRAKEIKNMDNGKALMEEGESSKRVKTR